MSNWSKNGMEFLKRCLWFLRALMFAYKMESCCEDEWTNEHRVPDHLTDHKGNDCKMLCKHWDQADKFTLTYDSQDFLKNILYVKLKCNLDHCNGDL